MGCVDLDSLALSTDSEGKSLKDFVVPVKCVVDTKLVEVYKMKDFPFAQTTLDVHCFQEASVKRIIFPVSVDIEAGDEITAYIVKAGGYRMPQPRTFYSRNFQEEEKAVKIEKYRDGKIIATCVVL